MSSQLALPRIEGTLSLHTRGQLTIVLVVAAAIGLMSATGMYAIAAGVAGVTLVALLVPHPRAFAVVTALAATNPEISIPIAGYHLHPFVVLGFASLFYVALVTKRMPSRTSIALFIAAAAVASTVLYGDLVISRALGAELLLLVAAAIGVGMRSDERFMRWTLTVMFASITVGSFYALLQVAHLAPQNTRFVDYAISSAGRPAAWYGEPDWLGLFAMVGVLIGLRLATVPGWIRYPATALCGLALLFSFARAAWVSVLLGIALQVFQSRREIRAAVTVPRRSWAVALGTFVLLGTCGLLVMPQLASEIANRIQSSVEGSSIDLGRYARLQQLTATGILLSETQWYGRGLSAAGNISSSGVINDPTAPENHVGSNWILDLYLEAGFVGIPFVAALLLLYLGRPSALPGQILVAVLVNSLASNALYYPLTWLVVALCLSGLASHGTSQSRRQLKAASSDLSSHWSREYSASG